MRFANLPFMGISIGPQKARMIGGNLGRIGRERATNKKRRRKAGSRCISLVFGGTDSQMQSSGTRADRPIPAVSSPAERLQGSVKVPGDKSLSHRALIFGALAEGESRVTNLLEGADVLASAHAVETLGARVRRENASEWTVIGGGLGALREPTDVICCGNSGTTARLVAGVIAANPVTATLSGDASLRSRPMERVFAPMREFGARIQSRDGGYLPASIRGTRRPLPVDWTLQVASAQVKSAILLAGLHAEGETRVVEPVSTRDHTERLLRRMGASIESRTREEGGMEHRLEGGHDLMPLEFAIPNDPSSAALVAAAALVVKGSDIVLPGVCVNPTRFGFFETLREMGAVVELEAPGAEGGEPVADLRIRQTALGGVRVPPSRAPTMIDEFPALAVIAAFAEGATRMEGVGELRAKECDRIAAMANGLSACGVRVEIEEDTLTVWGCGRPPGGATVCAEGDHRIAMAFLAFGLGAVRPVRVDDTRSVRVSFPGFQESLNGIGAGIREEPDP